VTTLVNWPALGPNQDPVGAPWTPLNGEDFQRLGNVLLPSNVNVSAKNTYVFSAPDDSWAQVRVSSVVNVGVALVLMRVNSSNEYYYFGADTQNNLYAIGKYNFGFTGLASGSLTLVDNDVIRAECQGTALRIYINGGLLDSASDATFASGDWGAQITNSPSLSNEIDLFQAGDFNTPAGAPGAANVYNQLLGRPK